MLGIPLRVGWKARIASQVYDRRHGLTTSLEDLRLPAIRVAETLSHWQYDTDIYIHLTRSDDHQRTEFFNLQSVRFDLMLFLSSLIHHFPNRLCQQCPQVPMNAQGKIIEAHFEIDGTTHKVKPPMVHSPTQGRDYYDLSVKCHKECSKLWRERVAAVGGTLDDSHLLEICRRICCANRSIKGLKYLQDRHVNSGSNTVSS